MSPPRKNFDRPVGVGGTMRVYAVTANVDKNLSVLFMEIDRNFVSSRLLSCVSTKAYLMIHFAHQ